jgi:trk system potassium uptake protein TrkA
METLAPQVFIGQSIGNLDIRAKHGLTIIGVRKKDQPNNKVCELNIAPRADYVIMQGDVLILLGSNENLNKFKHIDK